MRSRLCPEWARYEHATRFKFSPDNFFRGRLEHSSDGVALPDQASKLLQLDSRPHFTKRRSWWAHVASRIFV
jgi:hypothetical protein